MAPARLVPDAPLPPYSFVPGQHPHPESDPRGHSFGQKVEATPLDPDCWQACRAYCLGLDLFNAGFFWEAHAQWEALWHLAGKKGHRADFLKALIQLAAAGVKHREGRPAGVRSHGKRGADLFRGLGEGTCCGLSLAELVRTAQAIGNAGWPDPQPVLLPRDPP